MKKKDWIESLEKSNNEAEETNRKLKAKVAALKEEYSRLQLMAENRGSSLNLLQSIYWIENSNRDIVIKEEYRKKLNINGILISTASLKSQIEIAVRVRVIKTNQHFHCASRKILVLLKFLPECNVLLILDSCFSKRASWRIPRTTNSPIEASF